MCQRAIYLTNGYDCVQAVQNPSVLSRKQAQMCCAEQYLTVDLPDLNSRPFQGPTNRPKWLRIRTRLIRKTLEQPDLGLFGIIWDGFLPRLFPYCSRGQNALWFSCLPSTAYWAVHDPLNCPAEYANVEPAQTRWPNDVHLLPKLG
jgi:hypothetical protein